MVESGGHVAPADQGLAQGEVRRTGLQAGGTGGLDVVPQRAPQDTQRLFMRTTVDQHLPQRVARVRRGRAFAQTELLGQPDRFAQAGLGHGQVVTDRRRQGEIVQDLYARRIARTEEIDPDLVSPSLRALGLLVPTESPQRRRQVVPAQRDLLVDLAPQRAAHLQRLPVQGVGLVDASLVVAHTAESRHRLRDLLVGRVEVGPPQGERARRQ